MKKPLRFFPTTRINSAYATATKTDGVSAPLPMEYITRKANSRNSSDTRFATYRLSGKKIAGDAYVGYFKSHSYNTRLYSYERNIFNTFYMPSFYGKGMRLAFSAKYDIAPNLSFSAKAGYTRYFQPQCHWFGHGAN